MRGDTTEQPLYKMVDLFCGCGGISRGFQRTGRFAVEFGVECARHPARTFAHNIRNSSGEPPRVYQDDINCLIASPSIFWEELRYAGISSPREVDVVVGGPPCQGYSRNAPRRYVDEERQVRFYDDPRNHLYRAFLYAIGELQPKLVLIENVREFLNFGRGKFSQDLIARLAELGYDAVFAKLCAADFGVPQIRHRVFFVAIRKELADRCGVVPKIPSPKYSPATNQLSFLDLPRYRTVRDAIADLPSPVYRHEATPQPYGNGRCISGLAAELRSQSGLVHNHVARRLSAKSLARIQAVGTNRMAAIDPQLRTRSFYGSAYRRMSWDEPSLTITTWVYHVGSGAFAHPEEDRCITMREAARLQTFDDDFIFPPLINPVSQMIGNAVPPLLAYEFAVEFLRVLDATI